MRIGILGGTFDPIHFAHLLVAEDARARFGLERVLFIPNGAPPHRGQHTDAPAADRLRMCELATAANPAFAVSAMEIERSEVVAVVERVVHSEFSIMQTSRSFLLSYGGCRWPCGGFKVSAAQRRSGSAVVSKRAIMRISANRVRPRKAMRKDNHYRDR